jgi:sRNA-binding protein
MHEGISLLVELYPRCFCRTNRRPLKAGMYEEAQAEVYAEIIRLRERGVALSSA